jgi:hypothetical protein
MRWIRALVTTVSVIWAMSLAVASADEPKHWIIHDTGAVVAEHAGATVAYSDCEGRDEWPECQSIEFGCSETGDLLSINEDGRAIAARLSEGDYGEHSQITLRVGVASYEISVWDIRLQANDLDGIWSVTLEGSGFGPAFEAIAANPAAWVSASVAGTSYDLTARTADRPLLVAMAKTCAAK